MTSSDMRSNLSLRAFLFACVFLFCLSIFPAQSHILIPDTEPIIVNDTTVLDVGNLNLEEVMVELRRMKRSVRRNADLQQLHPAVPYAQPCPVSNYRNCCQTRRPTGRRLLPDIHTTIVVDERGIPVRETDFPSRPRRNQNEPEPLYRRRTRRVRFCPILDQTHPPVVIQASQNETGRCIISADQAVHYCGFSEEVSAPPIPPPETGKCHKSESSGREICYPEYEQLDTSCTDVKSDQGSGLVAPPVVKHATVRAMAFVPPDNLRRLIRQYYRQIGKPIPADTKFSPQSFLFVKYKCEFGYEFVDEIDTMFCQDKQWVLTAPICRGKGPCEQDNGGCSHSCLSFDNRTIECRCPKGLIIDTDKKTCIKPVPKNLCRNLAGCRCTALDELQFSCTCGGTKEKCLLLKGPPKIYLNPNPPFDVVPGGSINITCQSVGYPFPSIQWRREDEPEREMDVKKGAYRSDQILMLKDVYKNTKFICTAKNDEGSTSRTVQINVLGPGSPPILRTANAGRTSIQIAWDPPYTQNRPITGYTLYYTTNPHETLKFWKKIHVEEPQRVVTIPHLQPHRTYYIRVRAEDKMGPGKPSSTVSVSTLKPPTKPEIEIIGGEEISVAPNVSFSIGCNVVKSDPKPTLHWSLKGRPITQTKTTQLFTIEHVGLVEDAVFTCYAKNEAGTDEKNVTISINGPSVPEKVKAEVDGTSVLLSWEPPKYLNKELQGYEILYTTDGDKPVEEWNVAKVDDPAATIFTVDKLDEKSDYKFRVRAVSDRGPGLLSPVMDIKTWLGPKEPDVTIIPSENIISSPNMKEMVFNCEATGVPKPKIMWLWKSLPIEDGKDGYRIYEVKTDILDKSSSKLTVQSITRSGAITCQAVNKNGQDEKTTDVKILGPGGPPQNIKPSTQENGFTVDWDPPEHPNGDIIKYIIYYTPEDSDGDLADFQTKVVDGTDRTVVIDNQNENTPFVIRMQAISEDGPGIISESIKVTTGEKHIPLLVKLEVIDPQVTDGEETIVDPKQEIRFRCIAEGRPEPTVFFSWLPFNNTESGEEPVNIDTSLVSGKEYTYQSDEVTSYTLTRRQLLCQARNPDGTATDKHTFNVIKPGSPPKDILPAVDVDNKVTIKWQNPDHPNGDITGYTVYLSADPDKPLENWQVFNPPVSADGQPIIEFGRGELEPDTTYYVRVGANSDGGKGVLSDPITLDTVSGAPIDSPTDIVVDIAEDNTINLTWSGPKQPNGPLTGYVVYFTPEDPDTKDEDYKSWPHVDIQTNNDTGFVSLDNKEHNILPKHDYRAKISAKNDMNEGPASEPIHFKTGSGELPPVITLEPDDNPYMVPPKADVSIKCEASGVPQPRIKWIIGTDEHETAHLQIGDIRKDVTATCVAINNAGEAMQIVEIQVQGPGTPPNEVVAIPMTNQEINVEWTVPDEPNGNLKEYIIHYREVTDGEPQEWQTISVPPDAIRDKITSVKPKTMYAIKVQAVSDRGPGVESEPIAVTTLPLSPAAPNAADVVVHDNNTVVVKFDAVLNPEDKATNIKQYKILYTSEDPTLDQTQWKELIWTQPDDSPKIQVPIDGENFNPDTKYNVKVIPIGEIEGPSSDNSFFQTGDGIIPPDTPVINTEMEDGNIVRIPAGSDYTVTCTSQGFPTPYVRWVDHQGNQLSEDGMLRVYDVKTHKKAKCIAENPGGVKETDFTLFVAGPGNAPENIRVSANHPRTIEVRWDPPTIPNGIITRYIIYYTPLDDQDRAFQVGQVPKKPISEWMTYHVVGEHLNEGGKQAKLTDFVDADTAYAIVVQAANDDGPGPYSIQHSIRTMSKAREAAPKNLKVKPINQHSADVDWIPPEPSDETLLGYELYYIEGDKEIEEDDILSLPEFEKIEINDPSQLSLKIRDKLKPDTEYVFKIRAIYDNGPGVFSEPCITKTPPEGKKPYIVVSAGGQGEYGTTEIDLLPGSSYVVFCNATGDPQPSVKWIRGGSFAIDPSMVKTDETAAEWSLKLTNITEDTTFLCFAHNPLGSANWTIHVKTAKNLSPNFERNVVKAKIDDGIPKLVFTDLLPESLKKPGQWKVYVTDDPSLPLDQWELLPTTDETLNEIETPTLVPGNNYHIIVENPNDGITSPEFITVIPKAPHEVRVGTNINDETVVDFKPAISADEIQEHVIKYWPKDDDTETNYVKIKPDNITSGTVIENLIPGKEYVFQPIAQTADGKFIEGDKVETKIPTDDLKCECSHACKFDYQQQPVCYCPEGYKLANDAKTCVELTVQEEKEFVHAESTAETTVESQLTKIPDKTAFTEMPEKETTERITSPVPTDYFGATVVLEEDEIEVYPTDELGREIRPIVTIEGILIPTEEDGTVNGPNGTPIEKDEFGIPLDPNGDRLPTNEKGQYIYPPLNPDGKPYPTDSNGKHVFPIIDDQGELNKNKHGANIFRDGKLVPTNVYGKPTGIDGSPLPTDDIGRYMVAADYPTQIIPTDSIGNLLLPIVNQHGILLPTDETGAYINIYGNPIEHDEMGRPLGPDGNILPTNDLTQYVYPEPPIIEETKSTKQPIFVIGPDGQPLSTDDYGNILHPETSLPIPTKDGQFVRPDGSPLPTDGQGNIIFVTETEEPVQTLPTDDTGKIVYPIIGSDGFLLPTDETGAHVDARGNVIDQNDDGKPIGPDGNVLPTDDLERYLYPEPSIIEEPKSTKQPIVVIGPDGQPLPTNAYGNVLHPETSLPIPTKEGVPVGPDGSPLPTDEQGNIVFAVGTEEPIQTLPTDNSGNIVYPIVGSDGLLLPTDETGAHVDAKGDEIDRTDDGKPIGPDGNVLPTDDLGRYLYPEPSILVEVTTKKPILVIGPDGQPLPTDAYGNVLHPETSLPIPTKEGVPVGPDGSPLPTDEQGNIVFAVGTEEPIQTLPTDNSGNIVYPIVGSDGLLLPTDETGAHVDAKGDEIDRTDDGKPIGPDGNVLPTDDLGRYLYPEPSILVEITTKKPILVIGPDGQPFPTDAYGNVLHPETSLPIPTKEGVPVGPDGSPLPTDEQGNIVFVTETEEPVQTLPTDNSGNIVYPIVGSDGLLLPTDETGAHVDAHGNQIDRDDTGKPLSPDGNVLPTNNHEQFVYPESSVIKETKSTTQPIVIGPDGQPLATDSSGNILHPETGLPIPTKDGQFIHPDGSPYPTDEKGTVFVIDGIELPAKIVPTDNSGRIVYPIIGSDGLLLPTDETGAHVDAKGDEIDRTDDGKPIGPDGNVLPTDDLGRYLYPEPSILVEVTTKKPILVIGPDGQPLPTDAYGNVLHPETSLPIPTKEGVPVGPDGSPLPTDEQGNIVFVTETEEPVQTLPTDGTGKIVYPIIGSDGKLMPTDDTGAHVGANGNIIDQNDDGKPIGPDGNVLPTDDLGRYLYPEPSVIEIIRTTKRPGIVIGPDGQPYPTDEQGNIVTVGDIEETEQPISTDTGGKIVYPIIGSDGLLLPTDETGAHVDANGNVIDQNDDGKPIGTDGNVLPTDDLGRYLYPEPSIIEEPRSTKQPIVVIGPDGQPLPTDPYGNVLHPETNLPIPTKEGQLIRLDGSPYPTDKEGNFIIGVATEEPVKTLPTDDSGKIIYPIVGSDGVLLPTDETGSHVDAHGNQIDRDDTGKPLNSDGNILPTDNLGRFVYSEPSIIQEKKVLTTKQTTLVIGPDGQPLPTDDYGNVLHPETGVSLLTKDNGTFGPEGIPYPTNEAGEVIMISDTESPIHVLSTDNSGRIVYPIIGNDGLLLPTDETGAHVDAKGDEIDRTDDGKPIGPDGNVLPTDDLGRYLYPEPSILIATTTKKPIIVIGPDGQPLPTDDYGNVLHPETSLPIPTKEGVPVGPDGSPLPTDEQGNIVFVTETEEPVQTLPTDNSGNIVYPIIGNDGLLLPTDETGAHVDAKGDEIDRTDDGKPIGPDGNVLPTDDLGRYLYPEPSILVEITTKKPILVIGPDGQPFPTDAYGNVLHPETSLPIPTKEGVPVGPDGSPLPTDEQGNIVFVTEIQEPVQTLPTDGTGKIVYPIIGSDGKLMPTNDAGAHVDAKGNIIDQNDDGKPIGSDGNVLPTDDLGRYLYPEPSILIATTTKKPIIVIGPDGQPLPTDDYGNVLHPETSLPIPTKEGVPVGPDGSPLPTDEQGHIVFAVGTEEPVQTLPTDNSGNIVYPIIGNDGLLLPTDETGAHVDGHGNQIDRDDTGKPLSPDGNVLPTNNLGQFVYPEPSFIKVLKSTTRPIIIGPDGQPLPTDDYGNVLHPETSLPIPTKEGIPVGPDGSPLPTDEQGNIVFVTETEEPVQTLPTDDTGRIVYPIIGSDGKLMPYDDTGAHIDAKGNIIDQNDDGKPVGPDGNVLPTDNLGRYLYPEPSILVEVTTKKPILVIGPDGQPLPTDDYGNVLHPETSLPIPTKEGVPVGPDGSPLPTDEQGNIVFVTETEEPVQTLPTDDTGRIVYPIIGSDGQLLPTDESGAHIGVQGNIIDRDDAGKPLGPDGSILPTDNLGRYVFAEPGGYSSNCSLSKANLDVVFAVNNDLLVLYHSPILHFIRTMIGVHFDLSPDVTRIAVIVYGKNVEVPVTLGGYNEREEFDTIIRENLYYKDLGPPTMTAAFAAAGQQFTTFRRDSAARLLIVLTNGEDISNDKLNVAANILLIGPVSFEAEMESITKNNIYITEWNDLNAATVVTKLQQLCAVGQLSLLEAVGTEIYQVTTAKTPEAISHNCHDNFDKGRFLFVIETSSATEDEFSQLLPNVLQLIKTLGGQRSSSLGVMNYGSTVEVAVDIGNYDNFKEILEEIGDIHFVGGHPDVELALKIALELFKEISDQNEKVQAVIHFHKTTMSNNDYNRVELLENNKITVIDLDETQWTHAHNGLDYWKRKICSRFGVVKGAPVTLAGPGIDENATEKPTIDQKRPLHQIVNKDQQLLPTDETGAYINTYGNPIEHDEMGRPLGPDGNILPTNDLTQYVYPEPPIIEETKSTKQPIFVIGPDGQPLSTDDYGNILHPETSLPIPTKDGQFVRPDGSPLPTDGQGNIIFVTETEEPVQTLPTDDTGKIVYPIIGSDGFLLPTDETGAHVDARGNVIDQNDDGKPIGPDGNVLPTDDLERYLYPEPSIIEEPKSTKQPIVVIGPDGQPLPTDAYGNVLHPETSLPIPTKEGVPVGPDGSPLPTDEEGNIVFAVGTEEPIQTLPTDNSGNIVYPIVGSDGLLLPIDETGAHVDAKGDEIDRTDDGKPIGPDGNVLPTDDLGRYLYPEPSILVEITTKKPILVIGPDGQPFPTDAYGNVLHPETSLPIPTKEGVPVGPDGSPLPTDEQGNIVFVTETEEPVQTLPTDNSGNIVYPIVGSDGLLLPTDETGAHVDAHGNQIDRDDTGKPLSPDGNVLPTNNHEQFVYPESSVIKETKSTTQPIVIGPDGQPLATDSSGNILHPETGLPIPTKDGQFIHPDGSPYPTDEKGTVFVIDGIELPAKIVPTDNSGRIVYPIIGSDGLLLPTDETGAHVDAKGDEIDRTDDGKPIGPDGNVLPTDDLGRYLYPEPSILVEVTTKKPILVIGPDGQPLPTDAYGNVLHPETSLPIPTKEGVPVGPDGSPLPTDEQGNIVFVTETEEPVQTLPTDGTGKIVYPIIGSDGKLMPTDDTGAHVGANGNIIDQNDDGKPIGPDGNVLPTDDLGRYLYPEPSVIEIIRTTKRPGIVIGPDGQPYPTDEQGNIVTVGDIEETEQPISTDTGGKIVYPIIGSDGLLLPTDETGAHVDANGNVIDQNDDGKPIGTDGNVLPTDDLGRYLYPEPSIIEEPRSTKQPIVVIGPDGQPLPTDPYGNVLHPETNLPIPTKEGQLIRLDGSPYPTDKEGNFIIGVATEEPVKTLPTDDSGKIIYPIVGSDGVLLPTDETGSHVDAHGNQIDRDDTGKPLNSDGNILPTDNLGRFVYSEPSIIQEKKVLTTKQTTLVIGPDGQPLPTDDYGNVLHPETGVSLLTKDNGTVGPEGIPYPTNEAGEVIMISDTESPIHVLSTDNSGRIVYPIIGNDGLLLPTDETGAHVDAKGDEIDRTDDGKPIGPDGNVLPTDDLGRYLYPEPSILVEITTKKPILVIGPDGQPFPTDAYGNVLHPETSLPIPTKEGVPVGPDGSPLPTDEQGNIVFVTETEEPVQTLPTDNSGNIVYPIIGNDGLLLPTDETGAHVDAKGDEIDRTDDGKPIGPDGNVLPTDDLGRYLYPEPSILVEITTKKPILVIGPDGQPFPTDAYGNVLHPETSLPIPTKEGVPVGPDGSPLPTDEQGNIVFVTEIQEPVQTLPTDGTGKIVYPIIGSDGKLMPTNDAGAHVDAKGNIIDQNDDGKPIGSDGNVLPTDDLGRYLYPEPSILIATTTKKPIIVIGPDGQPLPTDDYGNVLHPETSLPIPTKEGVPVGPDGSPLPTDEQGHIVFAVGTEEPVQTLPTDNSGNIVYPIIGNDGLLLPTDETGAHVDGHGNQIDRDDTGKPLSPDGNVLPTNNLGQFVYPEPSFIKVLKSTTRPIIIGPDGQPLPTDDYGNVLHPETSLPIPTKEGIPVGPDGSPLPTDEQGNIVFVTETEEPVQTLPTDDTGRIVYPIIGSDGKLMPYDDTGAHIDAKGNIIDQNDDGKPVGPDGNVLPTDNLGRYLYPEPSILVEVTTKKPILVIGPDGQPLPTDDYGNVLHPETSLPIPTKEGVPVGPDGSPLPTDEQGNIVFVTETEEPVQTLPTDDTGRIVYPIIGSDGQLLPTDESGAHIGVQGNIIDRDDAGKPLGPDGNILPTDNLGRYVFAAPVSSTIIPSSRVPQVYVVDADNRLLPTLSSGGYVAPDGSVLAVDDQGRPVDADGSVLPIDSAGRFVFAGVSGSLSPFCYVNAYIDLVIVFDTSRNIKILDYRVMKEAVKQFLMENFNLKENHVRVGVVKYGDSVEVSIALGDYDHVPDLLSRIASTRRLKGDALLGQALKDVASEFLFSGISGAPKVVILFKSGKSNDDVSEPSRALRDSGAELFVVSVGEDSGQDLEIVGQGNENRILRFEQWRGVDSHDIGPIADKICSIIPNAKQADLKSTWPVRKTTVVGPKSSRVCNRIEYPVDVMVVVDSSTFDDEIFEHLKESIGVLVDESFDLSPDVVRVGFIVYTDKVSVPVALGHYEDKIELLQKITESDRISGVAIALKSLDAARQQFILHGRADASKVIVLITNGNNRGNAALAAQDLRDAFGIQIFAIAVNPSAERYNSLARLVGQEHANERLLRINSVEDLSGDQLTFIRQALCGHITPAAGYIGATESSWTTKRDVASEFVTPSYLDETRRTTRAIRPMPLCKDELIQSYSLSVVIDVTARSTLEDFRRVLTMISEFLEDRFGFASNRLSLNLITVDSSTVPLKRSNLSVGDYSSFTSELLQNSNDEISPKIGLGIKTAVNLVRNSAATNVNKLIFVVSSDGTSSDDAYPATDDAYNEQIKIFSISIREPTTDLLKRISGDSITRIIHFSEWINMKELFNSFFSYAFCETVGATSDFKATTVTLEPPKQTTGAIVSNEPSNIRVIPVSPNSFSVTWTCCTNNKADYVILYTSDTSLALSKWNRIPAKCRDSFGKVIDQLSTDSDYKVCVITNSSFVKNNAIVGDENCDTIKLNEESTPPPDYEPWDHEQQVSPCQCLCSDDGTAVIQSSCKQQDSGAFRPVATLPPALEGECPCSVRSHGGRCPSGYYLQKKMCIDVNECQQQNGGCSHGCINTPGDFYCACPHGMMRDPVDPKSCINVAGSFDRITELLARYLHANSKQVDGQKTAYSSSDGGRRFKATIKTDDNKELSFEWSSMPAMVRKALRWLI